MFVRFSVNYLIIHIELKSFQSSIHCKNYTKKGKIEKK